MKLRAMAAGALVFTSIATFADVIITDSFTYPDGSLTNGSAGLWVGNTGTAGSLLVAGNALTMSTSRTEDGYRNLGATYSTGTIYYGFTLTVTTLPNAGGTYFAHLITGTSDFRDRLWVRTTGASAGNFRLGVGNANTFGTDWGSDLQPNTTYQIVVGSNLDTDESYLWMNPTSIGSANVTNLSASAFNVTGMAFRQATGIGGLTIDNLVVATSFADIVPEPATLGLLLMAAATVLGLRRKQHA